MPTAAIAEATPAFFEDIYKQAAGDPSQVPWQRDHACPALVNWLNAVAPSLIRCGSRVAVSGCGLGRDAAALLHRGYDVVAFDVSETAVQWARQLDPSNADAYVKADVFDLPSRWRHRFDLVVEVNNVQAIQREGRADMLTALAELLAPHGRLLVVGYEGKSPTASGDGPPWPLTVGELEEAATAAGLIAEHPVQCFKDDDGFDVMRGVFRRG